MNTASITISNRDEDLPPLLLPSINPNMRNILLNSMNGSVPNNSTNLNGNNIDDNGLNTSPVKNDVFLHQKRQLNNNNNNNNNNDDDDDKSNNNNKNNIVNNGLESLASLATKRPRLSSGISNNNTVLSIPTPINSSSSSNSSTSNTITGSNTTIPASLLMGLHHNIHTPPPITQQNTLLNDTPRSITPRSSGIPSRSVTPLTRITPLNNNTNNITASPTSSVSSSSASVSTNSKNNTGAKRQRVGPSCDKCRLKKIKCDAHIEVLVQDESVMTFVTNNLHYALTRDDVQRNRSALMSQFHISNDTLNTFVEQSFDNYNPHIGNKQFINSISIIKHIDKLILFKPCLSCCKKKHSAIITNFVNNNNNNNNQTNPYEEFLNCCTFSKGFTRADINIFSRISKKIKGKTIYQMDVSDFKDAGL